MALQSHKTGQKSAFQASSHANRFNASLEIGRVETGSNHRRDGAALSKMKLVEGKAFSKSMDGSAGIPFHYYYARNARVKPAMSELQQKSVGSKEMASNQAENTLIRKTVSKNRKSQNPGMDNPSFELSVPEISKDVASRKTDQALIRKTASKNLKSNNLKVDKLSFDTKDPKSAAAKIKDAGKIELRSFVVEKNIAESVAESLTARVRAADMPCDMQVRAFRSARSALDKQKGTSLSCREVAFSLKKEFDNRYGPAWHCIVGTSFGSFVTHSVGGFLYFAIDKVSILLFKTAVEAVTFS
eukprot:TRINITY_DN9156_c0_g1_i1.p1 TRINITY_DN9156_c0_g1~~TRINITY_DN9156_c0_g1_i1.p1  ORF type:complete len:300 (+),score=10.69 TRINITY_DN9156_c0_g1_i1:591-1490(+)